MQASTSARTPEPPTHPRRLAALMGGVLICAGLAWACVQALAQPVVPAPGASAAAAASSPVRAASRPAAAPSAPRTGASTPASRASGKSGVKSAKVPAPTKPLWSELTEPQRKALAPLSAKWDTVSEAQKRKWLALSQNFPRLAPEEQAKLHSRMTEWVALSPQQRTQARLNFGNTQEISRDDKKAKWEAYQALSPEEKRKLAAGAAKPPPTAAALKPVPAEKLTKVPPPHEVSKPRIAAGANQVDQNTLLPQPASGPN
jgi:hypothetical protein